jgi:hypothetical protein
MWEDSSESFNGGTWSNGAEYTEGWFYKSDLAAKRGIENIESRADNVTADRTVLLGFDEDRNFTGVVHDFQLQPDGTIKDVAAGAN